MMFEAFNEDILVSSGKFFEYEMSLFALGLTSSAHEIHHFQMIKERYIPLAEPGPYPTWTI
ncbi:MAG: hypothetical protein AAF804_09915 [Bacteroidota bacterium]